MKKIKVGILGIGAIGSVIVSGLFRNKNLELQYFNRSKKEEVKIQNHDTFYHLAVPSQQDIYIPIKLDWLIICLKENHFADAESLIQKLISRKTKVAVIRNGIDLKKPLLPYAAENRILECMINSPTQLDPSGVYQMMGNPIIMSASGELSEAFQNLFESPDFTFLHVGDFKTENWKKLIESAALGALTCLTGETCWIFEDEKIMDLYGKLLKEGAEVAKADGAIISEDFVNVLLEKVKRYPKEKGSSMLTDRKLGRPIELNAKNGAISKVGKFHKIETPLNDLVCMLLEKTNKL